MKSFCGNSQWLSAKKSSFIDFNNFLNEQYAKNQAVTISELIESQEEYFTLLFIFKSLKVDNKSKYATVYSLHSYSIHQNIEC